MSDVASVAAAPEPQARITNFRAELARRRRGVWVYSAVSAVIAAALTIVLSAFVTPLILLLVGAALHLSARAGFEPAAARAGAAAIRAWASHGLDTMNQLTDNLDNVHGFADRALVLGPLATLAPFALPALGAGAFSWWVLRGAFLRAGGDDLATRLSARAVNDADPEEHQLANIVEEMAIAAGAPTPSVRIVDTPVANAAAMGPSHRAGVILVTRGLVDQLDRPETEAVVGRLVGAIATGDLRVAQSILAVLRTFGFFLTVLDLPLRFSAWRTLAESILAALAPRPSPRLLDDLAQGLEASTQADTVPDVEQMSKRLPRPLAPFLMFPLLPFLLINILFKTVLFLWTALFLGPPLALIWRSRCYWTDAMAVRLGRDPEALASALVKLAQSGVPPGAEAQAYLFLGVAGGGAAAARDRRTIALALPPSIAARTARLASMDAAAGWSRRPHGLIHWGQVLAHPVPALLVTFLLLLLLPLCSALLVMIGFMTVLAMSMSLTAGLAVVAALV